MLRARLSGFALMLLACSTLAQGATYVQIEDGELYAQADLIAEVVVLRELPARTGSPPSTPYLAAVHRILKGTSQASSLVLRSPGGNIGGDTEYVVPGAPRFEAGDRALVFLTREGRQGYGLLHMGLGVFHLEGHDEQTVAVRRLAGDTLLARDLDISFDLARDYPKFASWLEDRGRGMARQADYFVPRLGPIAAPYRLVQVGGMNVRWFEFDDGKTVNWSILNSAASSTQPQFIEALSVWSRPPVALRLASGTNSTAGFLRSDNVNAIIFGDPNNTFPGAFVCGAGGLIGGGGFWFSAAIGRYQGQDYRRIREADIVINDGAECLLNNNRRATAELFTREIGFTLGINFSDDPKATMSAVLNNDGRGASITADDIAALERLYGKASTPDPDPDPDPGPGPGPQELGAPSKLKVKTPKATLVRLRWKDNSDGETIFEIWRRVKQKNWKLWETKPANKKSLKSKNVKPNTDYTFRVRARKDEIVSAFSNEVMVTTPADKLAPPEDLEVEATSATTGTVTWTDNTKGEKLFQIERKEGDGEFSLWMTADANATNLEFDDGVSGATYTFRARAKKGSKVSDYSNEATVTMP